MDTEGAHLSLKAKEIVSTEHLNCAGSFTILQPSLSLSLSQPYNLMLVVYFTKNYPKKFSNLLKVTPMLSDGAQIRLAV